MSSEPGRSSRKHHRRSPAPLHPEWPALAGFTVAVSHRGNHNGEWQGVNDGFFRCTARRSVAENAAQTLEKGMRVFVAGKLVQRSWQDNDGNKRRTVEIQVSHVGPDLQFATAEVTTSTAEGSSAPSAAAGWWVTYMGCSALDRLQGVLHRRGTPATAAELLADAGEKRSVRGIHTRMLEDPRFVRINRQGQFAVPGWCFDEYTGITAEIAQDRAVGWPGH